MHIYLLKLGTGRTHGPSKIGTSKAYASAKAGHRHDFDKYTDKV